MESSLFSEDKNSEEFVKNRNLIFSMDYDSGYISHNPESNLDSSLENVENSIPLTSKPIYLSEDALLETPEGCKYPDISYQVKRENFEETRNIFNSPILSASTTHVSGSTESGCSREISFSGFNSDDSDVSIEIPCFKQITIDNISVGNAKNSAYNSSDLQDIKREVFKNMQNKNSVFNNITNTLATSDQTKRLTLIFSKSDKENVYSVKRKFCSLTPPADKNSSNGNCLTTPYKMEKDGENKLFNSNIEDLSKDEDKCLKCVKCNASISDDYTSFDDESTTFNESSINEYTNECKEIDIEDNKLELSSTLNPILPDDTEHINITKNQSEYSSFLQSVVAGTVGNVFKGFNEQEINIKSENINLGNPNEADINAHNLSPNENLIQECKEFNEVNSEPLILENLELKSENIDIEYSNIDEASVNIKSENIDKGSLINEASLDDIKSVVSETLQDMLNNLQRIHAENNVPINTSNLEFAKNINGKENSNNAGQVKNINSIKNTTFTPEKPYKNSNDSGLSPDLFTEEPIEEKVPEIIQPAATPKEKNVVKKDYMILRRAQNNLKGVIPPRSVTLIKISIAEMLNKIDSNKKYFWSSSTVNASREEPDSTSLLITSSMDACKNKPFPGILKDRCLGLYHNRSKFSEEFEELCVKYGQRYVGAETQSSCTVFETNVVSPTKRRNTKLQWNTKSPGKRLSHLARRRITFSSANLQSGSSFLGTRQILVESKKIDLSRRRSPRKSPRKTPRKTPGKSPRIKTRTPSSSAKKKLAMRFRKVTGEIEKSSINTSLDTATLSAKRTLFHSPDGDIKLNRFIPSTSGTSSIDNEFKRTGSKRALFMSPSKSSPLKNMGFKRSPVKRLDFGLEKKRKRPDDDSSEELQSKFPRSHSEVGSSMRSDVKTLGARARSELILSQNRQIRELTTNHKKKLQLAIYEALRSQSVLPTHSQFKTFASNLGRLTKKLFLMTTPDSVGVTEKMLRIARHHVISVVKGKSPEEIYEEFIKQRSKNLKPQGYVAPQEHILEKPLSERKVTLSGKTNNCENKIERIRKAINFGDDDNR